MIFFILFWVVVLAIAWFMGEEPTKFGDNGFGVIEYWVEWRVCHTNTFISYLLAFCLLFPRAVVIGYNIIAMYKNLFTLFFASNIAFIVNFLIAYSFCNAFGSDRPGWPDHPLQTCEETVCGVPDPAMVSSLSFVFQIAIMKATCGVGVSAEFIFYVLLFAFLYIVAAVFNNYMFVWQAFMAVGFSLGLAVIWAFVSYIFIVEMGDEITRLHTFRFFRLEKDFSIFRGSGTGQQQHSHQHHRGRGHRRGWLRGRNEDRGSTSSTMETPTYTINNIKR